MKYQIFEYTEKGKEILHKNLSYQTADHYSTVMQLEKQENVYGFGPMEDEEEEFSKIHKLVQELMKKGISDEDFAEELKKRMG